MEKIARLIVNHAKQILAATAILTLLAALMLFSVVLGVLISLPKLFLVIGLAALLALVAGAFPSFAKLLG